MSAHGSPEASHRLDLMGAVFGAVPDAILVLSAIRDVAGRLVDERIELSNPAWREYALGSPDAPDPVGQSFLRTVPHLEPRFELHRRVIETGLPYRHTVEAPGPRGSRWYQVEYTRLGDGILSVAREVTDEHEAIARLHESEAAARAASEHRQRFAMAMEHAPVGMAIVATDGRYVEVNDALCRMVGRDAETLHGLRWQDITHPDDVAGSRALTESLLDHSRASYKELKRYVRPDGRIVWAEISVASIRDDGGPVRYFVSQLMDVTDRIEAERALRASEERYRNLVGEIDGVVFVRDLVTGEAYCSPQVEVVLGYTADEMLRPGAWREHVVEEDRERVFAVWDDDGDSDGYDLDYRMRRSDGTVIWVEERWRSTRDASGRVTRWYGLTSDATRRKRLEEAVGRTDRLEAVSRVAAAAALDFGSVLTAIQFYLGNLGDTVEDGDPRAADVRGIEESVEIGVTLTKQLLAFGREVEDKEAAPIDVDWLLADLEPVLRGVAGTIHLSTRLAARGLVRIGRHTVEQMLLNLVNNARDAMPDGGSIVVSVERLVVGPGDGLDLAPGPYFVIGVTDTGVGMDAEVLGRAFEPLFTTKPNGTGTGLAQVYTMARAAGGTVSIESSVGVGTSVTILLPDVGSPDPGEDIVRY